MHALSTCDFCDAEAVGTFEIVPADLDPTETEQRRVVLCGDCQSLLADLLSPLLARAGADGGDANAGAGGADPAAPADDPADARTTGARDADPDRRATAGDGEDVVVAHDGVGATREDASAAGTDAAGGDAAGGDAAGGDAASDGVAAREETWTGITFDRDGDADGADPSADGASAEAAESAESATAARAPSGGGATAEPPAYKKVMRLLRNRKLPIRRVEVEDLVASAYDLEDDEVEAVIEHAIAEGEFVAEGDELRRP